MRVVEDLQSAPLNCGSVIRLIITQIQFQPIPFPLHHQEPKCKCNLSDLQSIQSLLKKQNLCFPINTFTNPTIVDSF